MSAEILPSMLSIKKINNSVSKIMAEDKQYCTERFEWRKEKNKSSEQTQAVKQS